MKFGKWITEKNGCESPVFRKKFSCGDIKSAGIKICGLGWFELFVNGKKVTDALFTPAVSTYEKLNGRQLLYPLSDDFVSPRIYYCRYDITKYLKNGENLISVQLGNGWYNQTRRDVEGDFSYGKPKLRFCAEIEKINGEKQIVISDETVKCNESALVENSLFFGEKWDFSKPHNYHDTDFDDSSFENAVCAEQPKGELTEFVYPEDKVIRTIVPKYLGMFEGKHVYDAGENISGAVRLDTLSDKVTITHAEEIYENGALNFSSSLNEQIQKCEYIGKEKNVHPHFSWQGFRYFAIEGEAENVVCDVIHTELKATADFYCEDGVINKIYEMYKRTQLMNIHGCVPLDCPHRERLGYTGDGQITCETVMHLFDARGLYKKWMQDIEDCSDSISGHIQHSAPFGGGGGGPAGWGGAAVVVPYTYYKMYGDENFVKKYLHCMTHWLDYMESRCENGLVTHEEKDGWCLGDWCYSGRGSEEDILSPEYVNTAYLIEFYDKILELDSEIGLGLPKNEYKARKAQHISAITDKYFDSDTGDFCKNYMGANVFAIDAGLGDERTLNNLIDMYRGFGGLDTGIFATEKLIGILTEKGYSELVYKLLSSRKAEHSFYYMYEKGATTFWESWDGGESHNHPMFGGCMKALWKCFLGINPQEAGYKKVKISPCNVKELGNFGGYITINKSKLSVKLSRGEEKIKIQIEMPKNIEGILSFENKNIKLKDGFNEIVFEA